MSRIEESISKLKRFKYHAIGRLELEDAIDNVVSWYEQMLKDAVEADVYAYKAPRFNCDFAEFIVAIPSAETDKLGDKVKLIIVKEDEK